MKNVPLLLQKISLTRFRNYDALRLDTGGAQVLVLSGANGAGKTNILEAISLLTPGRGLRGAPLPELTAKSEGAAPLPDAAGWAVAADIQSAAGHPIRIGTGLDRTATGAAKRVIRLNGKTARTQADLSAHIAAVWLTPQMDRIFLEGSAARRRFLDRLVFAHAPDHVTYLNRYDKGLRERMKLLTADRAPDPRWLDTLEQQIAADGISVAAARQHLLRRLGYHVDMLSTRETLFPTPWLQLSGTMDDMLDTRPAVEVEEFLQARLKKNRGLDAASGKTHEGAHRSDFLVRYAAKDMPADQCSTGEQKGLLLSIVLAHALMMQAERGFVPLLLLDEVAAHLDDVRRRQLFSHLLSLGGQVWLTGTEAAIFNDLRGHAHFLTVDDGQCHADARREAV